MAKTKQTFMAFFCILVFMMSFLSASALKEDFSATADSTVYSYQCSQTSVPIKITNTGSVGSSYELILSGEASNWARLSNTNLILYPGDTKVVHLYFGIPCDTKEADYDLRLSINTILGLEKQMDLSVNVEKPQNLNIIPITTAASIDPCTPVNFHVQVENKGSFTEEYEFSILSKNFRERITISENPVLVAPNTVKDVFFYVTPFACNEYGEYTIEASAFAKNSKLYSELYFDMAVNPTGIPVIAKGVGTIGINYTATEHDITIKNLGQTTAVYEAFLEGPEWVSLSPASFSLAPEGEGILTLSTSPSENTAEGKYSVTIVTQVASTGVEYVKDITIKLKEPTFLDTLLSQYLWAIILGAIVLVALIIVFIVYLRYLEKTKEIRAELKLQRQKEKEARRKEKERLKEQRLKEKEKLKAQKQKEKAQRKAERLAAIKERKKIIEQKKKERAKIKAQKKAEKLKIKKQKRAEKERLKKEREKESLRKEAEREKDKRMREVEKESRKEERRQSIVKKIALGHLKSEYIMTPKEKKKSPWLSWIIGIIILIIIAAGFVYTFIEQIQQFFSEFWQYVLIGVIALVILVLIIRALSKPSLKKLAKRELEAAKKELKRMLEVSFDFISRKELRKKKEEYKKKLKAARKEASKKMSKQMPSIAKWWIPAVIIIAVLVGIIYMFSGFIASNILYVIAAIAAVILLVLIITFASRIGVKKQRWKSLKANKTVSVPVKWSAGLYEIFVKVKREVKDVTVLVKRYSGKKTFYAPKDKVYQFFEIKRKNITNADIDKVSFRFRVKKAWLKNIKEGSIRLLRYSGGRWTGASTEIVSEDKRYVYFQASTKGFSHFAIVGKPAPKPEKKKEERKAEIKAGIKADKKAEKASLRTRESKIVREQKKAEKKAKKRSKKDKRKERKSRKPFSFLWVGYLILAILIIGGICLAAYFAISTIADARTSTSDNDQIPSPIEDEVSQVDISDFTEGEDITDDLGDLDAEEVGIVPSDGLEEQEDIMDDLDETEEALQELENDIDEFEGGIPKQVWDEDTSQTIDLNDYFTDPDNDSLIFSYTDLAHMTIELEEGIAILTPDTNWFGEEEIVFTADDGKGQSVDSNPVQLIVKNVPESSLFAQAKGSLFSYGKYVVVSIVVLILLILLFEYRKPIVKFLEEE